MQIIEKIQANKIIKNPTEIQKICLDKLKSNPLPNPKSELWRLSNKAKLSNFLNFSINNKNSNFELPYSKNYQNVIRLIIGESSPVDIKNKDYSIKLISNQELVNYIKKNISHFDLNEQWSELLNLGLSSEQTILGLKINGKRIPPLEVLSHATKENFNAKVYMPYEKRKNKSWFRELITISINVPLFRRE